MPRIEPLDNCLWLKALLLLKTQTPVKEHINPLCASTFSSKCMCLSFLCDAGKGTQKEMSAALNYSVAGVEVLAEHLEYTDNGDESV